MKLRREKMTRVKSSWRSCPLSLSRAGGKVCVMTCQGGLGSATRGELRQGRCSGGPNEGGRARSRRRTRRLGLLQRMQCTSRSDQGSEHARALNGQKEIYMCLEWSRWSVNNPLAAPTTEMLELRSRRGYGNERGGEQGCLTALERVDTYVNAQWHVKGRSAIETPRENNALRGPQRGETAKSVN
jgi:hypothetical protein